MNEDNGRSCEQFAKELGIRMKEHTIIPAPFGTTILEPDLLQMVVNESVMQWFEENKIWDWDLVFIKESWISEFPGLFGRYIFVFAEEKDAMLFALRWS